MGILAAGATVKVCLMILPIHCWFEKWEKARNAVQVHECSGEMIMNLTAMRGFHFLSQASQAQKYVSDFEPETKTGGTKQWKRNRKRKRTKERRKETAQSTTNGKKDFNHDRQRKIRHFSALWRAKIREEIWVSSSLRKASQGVEMHQWVHALTDSVFWEGTFDNDVAAGAKATEKNFGW